MIDNPYSGLITTFASCELKLQLKMMSAVKEVGNPITIIQSRLQVLRNEREQTQSDIDALLKEKQSIRAILPKVLHQLNQVKEGMDAKNRELKIYDNAIAEIELNYGHIIFTPEFYAPTLEEENNNV